MNKMDAINQQTVLRIFRAIRNVDNGLHTEEELNKFLHNIQSDYFDEMIEILGGEVNG